jgi:hypothetical protein
VSLDFSIQLDPAYAYGATTETPDGQLWNTQTGAYESYDGENLAHYDTGVEMDGRGIVSGSAPDGSNDNGVTPIVYVRKKAGANFIAAELLVSEVRFDVGGSAGRSITINDRDVEIDD